MQGRMRGQAFVIFPNQALATNALEEVNGYVLGGKPMVLVQLLVVLNPNDVSLFLRIL
jgi:RNA recognition motif-containing protein